MPEVFCLNVLEVDQETVQRLKSLVSKDRVERAEKFRRYSDEVNCISAEALVRCYLIEHYRINNQDIRFERNKWGKPQISVESFRQYEAKHLISPQFNVSHGGGWVVCAWDKTQIGVDVEKIRQASFEGICSQFHPEEQKRFSVPHEAGLFTRIWTLKESYAKYSGKGLFMPMDSFQVYESENGDGTWRVKEDRDVCLWQAELPGESILSVCALAAGYMNLHMMEISDLNKGLCENKEFLLTHGRR